ncbi:unnamed protein product [Boreogadus saida]
MESRFGTLRQRHSSVSMMRLECWKERKTLEKSKREKELKDVFKTGVYHPKDTFNFVALPPVPKSKARPKEKWGYQMKYMKSVLLANVNIKSFALDTPDGRTTVRQWKKVPFVVEDFNFLEYCNGLHGDPIN